MNERDLASYLLQHGFDIKDEFDSIYNTTPNSSLEIFAESMYEESLILHLKIKLYFNFNLTFDEVSSMLNKEFINKLMGSGFLKYKDKL